jgi:hypothetical protein
MNKITVAIKAWEDGSCSNGQLVIAIKATEEALITLRAFGANWVICAGLQNSLTSMQSAMEARFKAGICHDQ